MGRARGTMLECDRCGNWIFIDDATLAPDEQLEFHSRRLPSGWKTVDGVVLCSDCATIWAKEFNKFISKN